MVDEPCQSGSGMGEVAGADEDVAAVGGSVTDGVEGTMNECNGRRHWRRAPGHGRRHAAGRQMHQIIGRRGVATPRSGELATTTRAAKRQGS